MFVLDTHTDEEAKANISQFEVSEAKNLENFEFDWSKEAAYETYKLSLTSDGQILGLLSFSRVIEELRIEIRLLEISSKNRGEGKKYDRIAGILIAYACKESFQNGFYGFVSLVPKTRLIKHYEEKYGFQQFGKHLAVELETSEFLMNRYLTYEKGK